MLLFDVTHTSHSHAQTGIQRVCRSLFAELGRTGPVTGVCHDPYLKAWRPLNAGELRRMLPGRPAADTRGSSWSLRQRLSSRTRRWIGATPALPAATGLICPEFFSAKAGSKLPEILPQVSGPRVALFYDAIPLQFPELTPPGTVGRFPAYLRELLLFDGVAAISEASAACLRDYWRWLGAVNPPPVVAVPLAINPNAPVDAAPHSGPPRVLCVSTIEGRKNHLSLIEACEQLWQEGLRFELQLVGMGRADTAGRALAMMAELRRAGRPLLHHDTADDAELHAAYAQAAFTVYPSLVEGFGLPVLESLQHGKPCICSNRGALGESIAGGGCVGLASVDATHLADAIRRLLQNPAELAALAAQARARKFKTWPDYARELTAWMATLPRRA
ncbi:MAG: glycosyltransferase [Opitutae bacterium]|nr:glycosyltransferase [Opitutae bacterium]